MEESKRRTIANKGLLVTLVLLVIAIIGLVVGLILVNNKNSTNVVVDESIDLGDSVDEIMANTEELLENNEVDKVKELYRRKLEQMKNDGASEEALLEFTLIEMQLLEDAGRDEDALELILGVDCKEFEDDANEFACIAQAGVLAEKMNRADVLEDYYKRIKEFAERSDEISIEE